MSNEETNPIGDVELTIKPGDIVAANWRQSSFNITLTDNDGKVAIQLKPTSDKKIEITQETIKNILKESPRGTAAFVGLMNMADQTTNTKEFRDTINTLLVEFVNGFNDYTVNEIIKAQGGHKLR